jgi:type I restriction enzyme S subunit
MTDKKSKVNKVPNMRFPGFSGEWQIKKIREIASKINSGKTPLGGEAVYTNKGVLFIRSQNVNDNHLDIENAVFIPEEINNEMKNSIVYPNDILLNITGASLGRSCVVPMDFNIGNVNQHVCIIRLIKNNNPRFLQPYFSSNKGQNTFKSLQTGSGREGLNFESIKNQKVFIPFFSEQTKIATFLALLNLRIQTQNEIIEHLQSLKKGLLRTIFSQKKMFNDEQGNNFPNWKFVKLKDVFKRSTLKNNDNKLKYVLTNSALYGIVGQNEYFDKDIANQNNLQGYYIVDIDDFVYNPRISSGAPVGPLKRNKLALGVMSPLYTVLKPIKGNLDFFEFYFETNIWYKYMKSIANYGVRHDRMNITISDFENLPIPFPSLKEQTKIVDFLSSISDKIEIEKKLIEKYENQKKYFLQNMFI